MQRAIDIINCFGDGKTELSLSHISQKLGLNKSTVHGILRTLTANDFVRQTATGKYRIGRGLVNRFHTSNEENRSMLLESARPKMVTIANQFKMTVSLFIAENGILYLLDRCNPVNAIYTIDCISSDMSEPLYGTASGRIRLAFMRAAEVEKYFERTPLKPISIFTPTTKQAVLSRIEEIKSVGYSFENEELGEGVSAIAVPMVDQTGQLAATISVTGIAFHITKSKLELVNSLKSAAQEITQDLFSH